MNEVFILSAAMLTLAVSNAALAAAVPFLCWRCFRADAKIDAMEAKINTLDEALAELLEAAVGGRTR